MLSSRERRQKPAFIRLENCLPLLALIHFSEVRITSDLFIPYCNKQPEIYINASLHYKTYNFEIISTMEIEYIS